MSQSAKANKAPLSPDDVCCSVQAERANVKQRAIDTQHRWTLFLKFSVTLNSFCYCYGLDFFVHLQ